MHDEVKEGLRKHLIHTGFTYSNEGEWAGEPTLTRSVNVDVLLDSVVEFLIGAGYASADKATI
jgi:hypothetical protein